MRQLFINRPINLGVLYDATGDAVQAHQFGSRKRARRSTSSLLEATAGHKPQAAEILEVSRPRLNRITQRYGLFVNGSFA